MLPFSSKNNGIPSLSVSTIKKILSGVVTYAWDFDEVLKKSVRLYNLFVVLSSVSGSTSDNLTGFNFNIVS